MAPLRLFKAHIEHRDATTGFREGRVMLVEAPDFVEAARAFYRELENTPEWTIRDIRIETEYELIHGDNA